MSLTETGLDIKRLPDVLESLQESLRNELGSDLDLSSDSLLGIITSIYASEISDQWSLAQAVYSAFNIDTAEGKQLDDLVALVGITRLGESPTQGNIHFTGDNGTTVPTGTTVSDSLGNSFITTNIVTITLTSCYSADIVVDTVADSTLYNVVINGESYSYTSGIGATAESIISGLQDIITDTVDYSTSLVDNTTLKVFSDSLLTPISVTINSNLSTSSVTSIGFVECTTDGSIEVQSNTISNIDTPVSGLNSVNNPVALTTGRDVETDEELRQRQASSVAIAGTATVSAIQSTLSQLQGVTTSLVIENTSIEFDEQGRPPKSYECVVIGGVDTDIGQAIWDTKPAGIRTYGNTSVNAIDNQGNVQTVFFSRPEPIYIWAEVDYNIYDEEVFPSNGEDTIKSSLVSYITSLPLGKDAIPKRAYGSIYSSVEGIEDLTVRFGVSFDANTPPVSFSEDTVEIMNNEVADLTTDRVDVTLTV